jgi:hypothetical protein
MTSLKEMRRLAGLDSNPPDFQQHGPRSVMKSVVLEQQLSINMPPPVIGKDIKNKGMGKESGFVGCVSQPNTNKLINKKADKDDSESSKSGSDAPQTDKQEWAPLVAAAGRMAASRAGKAVITKAADYATSKKGQQYIGGALKKTADVAKNKVVDLADRAKKWANKDAESKQEETIPGEGSGEEMPSTKEIDPQVAKRKKANLRRKEREDAMRSLGLKKVKGSMGGTYWE